MLSIISALRCCRLLSCRSIRASPSCSITWFSSLLISSIRRLASSTSSVSSPSSFFCSSNDCLAEEEGENNPEIHQKFPGHVMPECSIAWQCRNHGPWLNFFRTTPILSFTLCLRLAPSIGGMCIPPGSYLLVAMYSSSFSIRFWFSSISRNFCFIFACGEEWIKHTWAHTRELRSNSGSNPTNTKNKTLTPFKEDWLPLLLH